MIAKVLDFFFSAYSNVEHNHEMAP